MSDQQAVVPVDTLPVSSMPVEDLTDLPEPVRSAAALLPQDDNPADHNEGTCGSNPLPPCFFLLNACPPFLSALDRLPNQSGERERNSTAEGGT